MPSAYFWLERESNTSLMRLTSLTAAPSPALSPPFLRARAGCPGRPFVLFAGPSMPITWRMVPVAGSCKRFVTWSCTDWTSIRLWAGSHPAPMNLAWAVMQTQSKHFISDKKTRDACPLLASGFRVGVMGIGFRVRVSKPLVNLVMRANSVPAHMLPTPKPPTLCLRVCAQLTPWYSLPSSAMAGN